MKKKAITFLEIIIATTVMVVAMIPIFGMLSRQTVETDKNATQAYAINKATQVLNTILDNVSFVAIRAGNPGFIRVDDIKDENGKYSDLTDSWAKKMATVLFNSTKKEKNGYPCKGTFTDSKGITYLIYMKVEDIVSRKRTEDSKGRHERLKIGKNFPNAAPNEFSDNEDVNFSFLVNPSILTCNEWTQKYREAKDDSSGEPFTEIQLGSEGIAEPSINFYTDDGLSLIKSSTKYGFVNPTAERLTAKMVMDKVPYKTDEDLAYCPFKRLIVQVQWNLDSKYHSDPENTKGNIQRIHLMAIKGDIDS